MEYTNIDESINSYNNSPQDKLSGLSPFQTYEIIHNPLGEKSPVKFRNDIDDKVLDKIPFFRIAEEFLKILERDKFIKLTPLGALPKKIMVELYDYKFIPDEHIESGITKLWKESDCISIRSARIVCEQAKFVKKINGKLSLTKNGQKNLKPENRLILFKYIYLTFTEKFNWAYNDGYTPEPAGQYGSLFSIYLLLKYGAYENTTMFYSEKYVSVFYNFLPLFENDYSTAEHDFNRCFALRTFERFTDWFGFTIFLKQNTYIDVETDSIQATALIKEIFYLESCD